MSDVFGAPGFWDRPMDPMLRPPVGEPDDPEEEE